MYTGVCDPIIERNTRRPQVYSIQNWYGISAGQLGYQL